MTANRENLGPAERIINTLLTYSDHMYHGRPGMVTTSPSAVAGVAWQPVTHKVEADGRKSIYALTKVGRKQTRTLLGKLDADGKTVKEVNRRIGEYRPAGLFPEIVAHMYSQIAEVLGAELKAAC